MAGRRSVCPLGVKALLYKAKDDGADQLHQASGTEDTGGSKTGTAATASRSQGGRGA